MRNIFIFIILANFSSLLAHTLPNNVILDCNLPAPTNLHSVEVGPSYATMAWDAVPGAAGYLVSWFNESGAQVNSDTTLDTEYEVQGLESGKTYNFRVASVCNSGGTGTIYSTVIVVPIIVELLISTDNPLGNLNVICEKNINPVTECLIDFSAATTYFGKIEFKKRKGSYYFRIRYFSDLNKNEDPKIVIDLIKPEFYPEPPVPKPSLLTENGKPSGLIFQYGSARLNNVPYYEIRITKTMGTLYNINIFSLWPNIEDQYFTLLNNTIPSFSKIDQPIELTDDNLSALLNENSQEDSKSFKQIRVVDMNGVIVREIKLDKNDFFYKSYLFGLANGIYVLNIFQQEGYYSKMFYWGSN